MDGRTLRVLVRSLVRFRWVLPVVANRRTNRIVGGHQRARANAHIVKTGSARRKKDYSRHVDAITMFKMWSKRRKR